MPAFLLKQDEVEALSAYLEWIAPRRYELLAVNNRMLERQAFAWTEVPWFEYQQ